MMQFPISERNRVRANNHAARRKGSLVDAIRMWHRVRGGKPFHLDDMRRFLREQRCVWMSSLNVEQKTLMRLHKSGECPLDMSRTLVRQERYQFRSNVDAT